MYAFVMCHCLVTEWRRVCMTVSVASRPRTLLRCVADTDRSASSRLRSEFPRAARVIRPTRSRDCSHGDLEEALGHPVARPGRATVLSLPSCRDLSMLRLSEFGNHRMPHRRSSMTTVSPSATNIAHRGRLHVNSPSAAMSYMRRFLQHVPCRKGFTRSAARRSGIQLPARS